MSKYNEQTINAEFDIEFIENDGDTIWEVTTKSPIHIDGTEPRVLPVGATFKYRGTDGETEDEAHSYVSSHGILDACKVSDADFERMLEEDEDA